VHGYTCPSDSDHIRFGSLKTKKAPRPFSKKEVGLFSCYNPQVQNGNLYKDHGAWYLRWWEDGRRVTKRLGSLKEFRTKNLIEPLARDILSKVNRVTHPDGGMTLDAFTEEMYLPHVREHLRASTAKGYADIHRVHLDGRKEAQLRIREYRTVDVQALLNAIARDNDLTKTTLQHIKHCLSGIFRYAAISGLREGNPVREALVPKAREGAKTYAYSVAEIGALLDKLEFLPKAAVAVAAFAGLRLAELHGLDWSNYDGRDIKVETSMWRGIKSTPKSRASQNYVPAIPQLSSILDGYRQSMGNPAVGPMFPMELEHVGNLKVRAVAESIGLRWYGWHAFRRGIASNLYELGADDLTVQRVLRHSKVIVTREHYIKVRDPKLDAAMQKLSDAFGQQLDSKASVSH
jgi:integrase